MIQPKARESELLPCPLCRSRNVEVQHLPDRFVVCLDCGCMAPRPAWNTRPAPALPVGDVEGVRPERLAELLAKIQQGGRRLPWALWTSCSYRRIKTGVLLGDRDDGKEVLGAYRCSDGGLDLSMPEDQLEALVELLNAFPALLASLPRGEEAK